MFYFFFKPISCFFVSIFKEVLKYFFKNNYSNYFVLNSSLIFSLVLWPDENTYYVFFSFFNFLFFSNLFHLNFFFSFFHYIYFYFLSNIFTIFIYKNFLIYIFFGFFLLFLFFLVFLFFVFFSFVLNSLEILFKTKLSGLVLFSKDFLSIEDEDLWVSSTLFYFDNKVLEAKDFKTSLSVQEIEVFQTIIKLFFDVPSKNFEYLFFSNELLLYKNNLKNYLNSGTISSLDADKFFLNLKSKAFLKFPAYSSSLKSFDSSFNKNFDGSRFFSKYFRPLYNFSFFGSLFHLSNFVFPSQKRRKLKSKIQKYEKRVYLRKRVKAFRNYMKGYYFSKYGLLYKKLDLKNSKFSLINPIQKNIPDYLKNQIKNETIYWQNRQSIINYYTSFKSDLQYFSSSINFPRNTFKFFREVSMYNNLNNRSKLQRFRKFFWFSFPFYVLETTWNLKSFFHLKKLFHFILYVYNMVLSRFFYAIFSLFGDLILNDNYESSLNLSKNERNFFYFLTKKYNNKTIFDLIYDAFFPISLFSSDSLFENVSNQKKNKLDDLNVPQLIDSKSQKKKIEKSISLRKKKRYKKYLERKKGAFKKNVLQNSKKYSFSNKFNSQSFLSQPNIEVLDFYKLLEYFYFVLTNDVDFYENAQFLAKVELLRQKYGQSIVSDLLNREDHKIASKVSVQMHVVDYDLSSVSDSEAQLNLNSSKKDNLSTVDADQSQKNLSKNSFYVSRTKSVFYKKQVNLIDDLVLSYKYRFKK